MSDNKYPKVSFNGEVLEVKSIETKKPSMTIGNETVTLPADSIEFECETFDTDICIGETERDDIEQPCASGTINYEKEGKDEKP